nr:DEAD/DEAH box helicase [Providencia rustigianii]
MAKTSRIIQAKEQTYMKETISMNQTQQTEITEEKLALATKKQGKFKEVVCPNVPMSYFKRAKKQKSWAK